MPASDHGTPPDPPPAIPDNTPETSLPRAAKVAEDGGDSCRICRGEASPEQPLFYPCKCSGSIRFVHQDCLMEWLSHSKKKYCELCKTPFRFTKLYDKSMPAVLPLPLFVRQLCLHFFGTVSRWARYTLVASVWFVCLPWCIRQIWRGLFWLADGSWLSEAEIRRSALRQLNATLADPKHISTTITEQGMENVNTTILDALLNSTSYSPSELNRATYSLLSTVLRFMAGETLVSKILRTLLSIPPLQLGQSSDSNHTQALSARYVLQRPPSLLSDVKFIRNLSPLPFLSHITLDVLEGILICLGLVAGFILIFLIREWVINQQPLLNIPDPDGAENPPPPAAPLANEVRPIIRPRRRRILPRAVDAVARADGDAHQPQVQPIPVLPPRRAFTDDNIGIPAPAGFEQPTFPVRSHSLANVRPEAEFKEQDRLEGPTTNTPPPLLRGAIGEAVNVHRTMEEAPIAFDGIEVHPSRLFDEPDTMPSSSGLQEVNDIAESPLPMPTAPVVQFQVEPEVIGDASSQSSLVIEPDSQQSSDSDYVPVPTPSSSENNSEDGREDVQTGNRVLTAEAEDVPQSPVHLPPPDRLAEWLWQVEAPVVAPPSPDIHDEEQIVADVQAEAPFVPVHNRGILPEQNLLPNPGAPVNLEQALQQPNVPQNIDWNDPNAADEIEDLEGVLELIGMEGPLVGMIQNVIFSLFLITVTLTASVWIPYIWGKITLLLIANPVVVLIKAPVFLISNTADVIADLVFFILGILGLVFNIVTRLVKAFTMTIFPPLGNFLDTDLIGELSLNVTHRSGTRLEKTLAATFWTLSPDLPAFSVQSHRALVSFKLTLRALHALICATTVKVYTSFGRLTWSLSETRSYIQYTVHIVLALPELASDASKTAMTSVNNAFKVQLKPLSLDTVSSHDLALAEWSTEDKVVAIIMGYVFFAFLGYGFLRAAHLVLGLKKDEKVEGPVADSLRQAGGVLKVIVIIGIEMIVFPLYCGLLLDLALLPLFEGATVQTRLAFIARAPFTGLFLHWFVGTCYMFHFALFVSICRKILRKGVLYFVRDPDDPTFHPVRDVLERPVPTQLGKIAFSALVYGGLVIMCLGGVVWGVGCIDDILPIQWSTPEPRLAFPIDVIFYNFMLPFIVRKVEPSKKVAIIFEWWFRGCAHGLRLTQFLFGDEREDEKMTRLRQWPWRPAKANSTQKDGTYVRAPASDSCRIPRDKKVFLEVNEDNERLDGLPDSDKGLHGKTDDKWTKVYLPPQFKARVATFVGLLWLFAAGTGVASTVGPLLLGRTALRRLSSSDAPVNDLYALTVGIHLIGTFAYVAANCTTLATWLRKRPTEYFSNFRQTLPRTWSAIKYGAGLVYLSAAFGLVFPFVLSLIAELYIHIPIFTFLLSREERTTRPHTTVEPPSSLLSGFPPTVFLLQTWTLGLLYLRLAFRIALNYPCPHTRLSTAIRTVVRDGYLHPDVRLASRAIILPLTALCVILLGAPLLYAKTLIMLMHVTDPEVTMQIYRMAFPGLMGLALTAYGVVMMKWRLEVWRVRVRDEVYLVGERLHNYVDRKGSRRRSKAKERVA